VVEEYFAMDFCEKHMLVESYHGFTKGIQIIGHGKWQLLLHSFTQVNIWLLRKTILKIPQPVFLHFFLLSL